MKKLFTSLCALAFLAVGLHAQNVTVQDAVGMSPQTLVRESLAGGGVYIFNVKHQNSLSSIKTRNIGTFNTNGFEGLGFEKTTGLLITTGDISVAEGPNTSTGATDASTGGIYDDMLNALAGSSSVTNCSVIDFDFVCFNDKFSFNYCFGSEEYPEWACSSYNDCFGFFLTGIDPETGEETTRNLAVIPYTISDENPLGIPVTINSVNDVGEDDEAKQCYSEYSTYYIDNNYAYGSDSNYGVEYDGYTYKLFAEATVVPCEVYHLHIGVCNVSDTQLDSGVFIEGGSFETPSTAIGLSRPGVDVISGSCPFIIPITLAGTDFTNGTVHFSYGGSAVHGVDYLVYDSKDNPIDELPIDYRTSNFYIKALPGADLSVDKTIELYLSTSLCDNFPQLRADDTMHFKMTKGSDVKLADTTIKADHACFEVSAPIVYGAEPITYLWQMADGSPAVGIDNPYARTSTAMIFASSEYRLIATGGTGCSNDTAYVHVQITGDDHGPVAIDQADASSAIVALDGDLLSISADGLTRVEIFSIEGRLVADYSFASVSTPVTVSVDRLNAGVYGVRVSAANGVSGSKIVLNK